MTQPTDAPVPVKRTNLVRARVTIRGTRPLLQHAFTEHAIPLEKGEKSGVAGNDPSEWKRTCQVTGDGQLYLRSINAFGCIRDAAKHTKKGKGSIQPLVAATLQVEESVILIDRRLPAGDPPRDPTAPVYIDVAGVRNPSTKARNVRYRLACSTGWQCSFTLLWDKTIVSREQMRAVLNDASILVGIGDGRSVGNGRFEVVAFEELSNAEEATAPRSVESVAPDRVGTRRKGVRPVQSVAEADGVSHWPRY